MLVCICTKRRLENN